MLTPDHADVLARLLAAPGPLLAAEFGLPDTRARVLLAELRREGLAEQHNGGWRAVDNARPAAAFAVNRARQLHALRHGFSVRETAAEGM